MNNLQGALHSSSVRILPPSIHASILFDQRSPVNVEKSFWEAEYLVPNCTPLIVVSLITRRDLTSNAISSLPDGVFKGMANLFYLYVLAKRICPSIHPSSLPSIHPSIHPSIYRAFSHDVTTAILVFQNNKTAAMLVFQTNPVGVELFSYVNASFCFNKFA